MDGAIFYERLRILLHDKGEGFVEPNPHWKDREIELRAQAALESVYTTLLDRAEFTGKPSVTISRMQWGAAASQGLLVPDDFYRLVIGRKANGAYVNADPFAIAAASAGFDAVYASAGFFRGTADYAIYWKRPVGPVKRTSANMDDFPDGFYDTVITATAIELLMGEGQNTEDRIAALNELLLSQLESLA